MTDDSSTGSSVATEDPNLETIRTTVEKLLAAEAKRRTAVQAELDGVEGDGKTGFDRTRDIVASEREQLETLDSLLAAERTRIDDLEDASAYFQTDQAVRNREEALRRLQQHNTHLQTFHDALSAALDAVTANLDALERGPTDTLPDDAEPHLQAARDAIEDHNDAIENLGKNLRILTQYMR